MNTLTSEQLRTVAPSIFTRSAYHTMSPRYKVAATADVVELLEGIGLFPVRAQQSRCRLPDKKDYVKHLIRFRRSEDMNAEVATEIPEVVLTNSFDGSTAYKLNCGLFRVACTNGLVCPTSDLGGISVRHSGGDDFAKRILEATYTVVSETPNIMETVREWKQIQLPAPMQAAYADAAIVLKDTTAITPDDILHPRRREDAPETDGTRSLWTTFNCVQEHLLKGGDQGKSARGRRITTRPITSVASDMRLNKALWVLAEKLAEAI